MFLSVGQVLKLGYPGPAGALVSWFFRGPRPDVPYPRPEAKKKGLRRGQGVPIDGSFEPRERSET